MNKILLGVLGGAAIGAALALLYAPESGEETRKKISDTAGDLTDKIMKKAEEILAAAGDTLGKGHDTSKNV